MGIQRRRVIMLYVLKLSIIASVSAFSPALYESLNIRTALGSHRRRLKRIIRCKASTSSLDDIQRIFAISDLHTDNIDNLKWLRESCTKSNPLAPTSKDALIIAGDISHELSKLSEAFSIIQENCGCHIFFVFGNHEAWVGGNEMDALGIRTSLEKLEVVNALCLKHGVHTDMRLIGANYDNPVFLVPIESWYDGSLSLPGCEDLCDSFDTWPWVDFKRCVWPSGEELRNFTRKQNYNYYRPANGSLSTANEIHTGRIPVGLSEYFANVNQKRISRVKRYYQSWNSVHFNPKQQSQKRSKSLPGLITYSHFLPNLKTLPDWKDPSCDRFQREYWLDHPVPKVSCNFAKVSGSALIDDQIRSIVPHDNHELKIQHLHVFGHSHRPKDFVLDGIRYIHNPLGKPRERQMKMVSESVNFQLIWDCSKSSLSEFNDDDDDISFTGGDGEVPGVRIIRFWEEKGGGKVALARRMKLNQRMRRIQMKRFLRDVKNNELN